MISSQNSAEAMPEPGDSPARFCVDFASLMDKRGVSLRAAARSGWGKSTIATARKGPDLPNVELVLDVLETIGESESTREQWRSRHQQLRQAASHSAPASKEKTRAALTVQPAKADAVAGADAAVAGPATASDSTKFEPVTQQDVQGDDLPASPLRRRSRGWPVMAAIVVVVVLGAGGAAWVSRPDTAPERTIVVQNKVAFGMSDLQEDDSPSYLAARPIARCANVVGCKLKGTDMGSGDIVTAVCQLQGATLTNADVRSAGIENNPNAAASALWYGIRWPDGRHGYLSEVYVAPLYRGGLQLPPC